MYIIYSYLLYIAFMYLIEQRLNSNVFTFLFSSKYFGFIVVVTVYGSPAKQLLIFLVCIINLSILKIIIIYYLLSVLLIASFIL